MKTPAALQALVDEGIVQAVVRQLKSGKEASVYIVRCGDELRCAKVYKDLAQRSFQARATYQEGRKVRGSRQSRAIGKGSKFGKRQLEEAWKNTEVDALYALSAANVRVPRPVGYFGGVLVMELIVDDAGHSAPRLGEVELDAETAREYFGFLVRQVVRMLCAGMIHGDLSEYNVLVDAHGPVIIDLPQAVSAAGNNAARAMLLRDVNKLRSTLAFFAPELELLHYGEEMWALFEKGELQPETVLTGRFEFSTAEADVGAVLMSIEDARQEAIIRQQGREAAEQDD